MLAYQRSNALEDLGWNEFPLPTDCWDRITTLECWKYKGVDGVVPGANFVTRSIADQTRAKGTRYGEVEERLEQWLEGKTPYGVPPPPADAGELTGGLRVVFCERIARFASPSMSRAAYEAVEWKFGLHPATLPSVRLSDGVLARFLNRDASGGLETVDLIIRSRGKKEVTNGLAALHYDVRQRCTTVWICASGLSQDSVQYDTAAMDIAGTSGVRDVARSGHQDSQLAGNQLEQLVMAIKGAPELWDHPLLLPNAMLHVYFLRAHVCTRILDANMIKLENQMGVTHAGAARPAYSEHWPLDVDPKKMMVPLVSMLPEASFMVRCSEWLQEFSAFLNTLSVQLGEEPALSHLAKGSEAVRDSARYFDSATIGQISFFRSIKDRASSQMSLLYSIISQQESASSRWISHVNQLIAEATKEDSVSVTTFTFITALFLPGTFVATLFSMTMFDWGIEDPDSVAAGSSLFVSNKFWIFWVVAFPLTSATILGWRLWFRYATSKWKTTLATEKERRDLSGPMFHSLEHKHVALNHPWNQ